MITYGFCRPVSLVARYASHAKRRDWSHKQSTKAPLTGIKRDSRNRKVSQVHPWPPELMQAARRLGMSCAKLNGLLELQRKHAK